ncbi:MAG: hypothetical protein OHK0029_36680 [Armatimonadaceae bacterium]
MEYKSEVSAELMTEIQRLKQQLNRQKVWNGMLLTAFLLSSALVANLVVKTGEALTIVREHTLSVRKVWLKMQELHPEANSEKVQAEDRRRENGSQ